MELWEGGAQRDGGGGEEKDRTDRSWVKECEFVWRGIKASWWESSFGGKGKFWHKNTSRVSKNNTAVVEKLLVWGLGASAAFFTVRITLKSFELKERERCFNKKKGIINSLHCCWKQISADYHFEDNLTTAIWNFSAKKSVFSREEPLICVKLTRWSDAMLMRSVSDSHTTPNRTGAQWAGRASSLCSSPHWCASAQVIYLIIYNHNLCHSEHSPRLNIVKYRLFVALLGDIVIWKTL